MFTKTAGFTLIELLVVIAVIGALAGALIVVIDPVTMINRARIGKGKNFQGQLVDQLGFYEVGAWNFNDPANPGQDISGSNATLTIFGATYTANCDLGFGGCYSLNGTSDYLQTAANISQLNLTGSITLSMWIKPTVLTGQRALIVKRLNNVVSPYTFYTFNDGLRYIYYGVDSAWHTYNSVSSIISTNWQMVTTVYDTSSNTIKFYVNGTPQGPAQTTTSTPVTTNTEQLRIGYDIPAYGYFSGSIDEVYIFNQSLSQARIEQLYTYGVKNHLFASLNSYD